MDLTHPTLKDPRTGAPLTAIGVLPSGKVVWPIMGASEDDPSSGGGGGDEPKEGEAKFTQADLDRILGERLGRQKTEIEAKFKDYPDLKKQAEGAKTAEQQIADLTKTVNDTKLDALRSKIQAKYGVSTEDAELFMTGGDEETLERQAKRLKEQADARAKNGNGRVPREGGNSRPVVTDEKQAVRTLFGSGS